MIDVKIVKLTKDARTPMYMTEGAVGCDLFATTDVVIPSHQIKTVGTGIAMEIPVGYEAQIRPRSGLAANEGVAAVLGTIDSDYRGEIRIILQNTRPTSPYYVNKGDRIAQIVFSKVPIASFTEVESLGTTIRGEGGFGHTGVKDEKNI